MKPYLSQAHSVSGIQDKAKTYTLQWQIPDFEWLLNNQTNREIRMNTTNCTEKTENTVTEEDSKFQVKIRLLGNQNDLIEIYYLSPLKYVKVILTFWSKTSGNYMDESSKDYHWVKTRKWQLLAVLFKQTIINEKMHSNGTLYLKFEFCYKNKATILEKILPGPHFCVDRHEYNRSKPYLLINDLENLFGNPSFSDVKVKSVEGVEFEAHKVILVTRSVVLRAHFEHNTVESLTNVVETPLEAEVLKEMLSYIYTENVPKIDDMPEKLLMAADFYQLIGLKMLCEKALYKKLNVNNAIEILELANLHRALNLKRQTLEFIHDGLARDIIQTRGWENLQSATLIKSLYEYNIINN